MDALPGAPATANPQVLTAPTALPQTAIAGLPVQPADPVLPAGEPLLDAVAGSGLQSLMAAFPSGGGLTVAASPSGPQTTLAVPQTIAQITAGLVASPTGITELALAPEELGHVRLRLEPDAAQPDRMLVMISVERPETLDLLRRHAGELADALRDAGYSGADIGFSQNGSQDQARSQHPHADQGPALGHDDPPPPPARPAVAGATLDLRL
jgi:Flagellar hook-length control protein FliK